MKEYFKTNSNYSSFNEIIKKYASNFSKELKERYDLLFASQIVSKMSEQGLLKDDKIKELLK